MKLWFLNMSVIILACICCITKYRLLFLFFSIQVTLENNRLVLLVSGTKYLICYSKIYQRTKNVLQEVRRCLLLKEPQCMYAIVELQWVRVAYLWEYLIITKFHVWRIHDKVPLYIILIAGLFFIYRNRETVQKRGCKYSKFWPMKIVYEKWWKCLAQEYWCKI